MSFDEEHRDPHEECAAEIHRLQSEVERLKRALSEIAVNIRTHVGHGDFIEQPLDGAVCQELARKALETVG